MAADLDDVVFPCNKPWFVCRFGVMYPHEFARTLRFEADFNVSLDEGTVAIFDASSVDPQQPIMTYPHSANFVAYNGNSIEYKVMIEHIGMDLNNMKLRAETYSHCISTGDLTYPMIIKTDQGPITTTTTVNTDTFEIP